MRANATQDSGVSHYEALTALGEGSDVFRARDGERFVAVRLWFGASADETRAIRERVSRASAVSHPMLASVEACVERGNGVLQIVSEYVPGPTLEAWCRGGRNLPVASAVDLIRRLCGGVQSALAHGIAPVALNPRNLVVRRVDGATELDAKLLDLEVSGSMRPEPPPLEAAHFIAPEILPLLEDDPSARETLDARAHVFACGALLYYLTTRTLAFQSHSEVSLIEAHFASSLVTPRSLNPALSEELERVIMRALAIDPSGRQADPSEFASELGSCAVNTPTSDASWMPAGDASASWLANEAVDAAQSHPDFESITGLISSITEPSEQAPRTVQAQSDAAGLGDSTPPTPARRSRFRFWVSFAAITAGVVSYFAVLELTAAADRRSDKELHPRLSQGVAPVTLATSAATPVQQHSPAEPARKQHTQPSAARETISAQAKPLASGAMPAIARAAAASKASTADVPSRASQFRSAALTAGAASSDPGTSALQSITEQAPTAAAVGAAAPVTAASEPPIESRIYGLAVRGSLVKSSVGRAIERVLPHWNACYARVLQHHPENSTGALHVDMTIDEMGRARNPHVISEDSPSLGECVTRASNKFASQAPDTGTVEVSFNVRFKR